MSRTEAERLEALHHRLAETERHLGDAVLRLHVAERIEVVRGGGARERRVEAVAAAAADQPLDQHRHQLLLDPVGRGLEVVACGFKEGGGVDHLDRLEELGEPDVERGVVVGQHDGGVDAREGLVDRVLEDARRAYGDGFTHPFEEGAEIRPQLVLETCAPEVVQDLLVVHFTDAGDEAAQTIVFEEFLEDVAGEDHGLRDGNLDPFDVEELMREDLVHERQPAAFAAERAGADLRECGEIVEPRVVEVGDDVALYFAQIPGDGVDQKAAQIGR